MELLDVFVGLGKEPVAKLFLGVDEGFDLRLILVIFVAVAGNDGLVRYHDGRVQQSQPGLQ